MRKTLTLVGVLFLLVAALVYGKATTINIDQKPTGDWFRSGGTKDLGWRWMKEIDSSGTAAGRGFSPAIWDTCPVMKFMLNPQAGFVYFNDFRNKGVAVANNKNVAAAAALGTCGDVDACTAATSGTTISTLATDANGIVHLESTTADEDAIISVLGGNNTAGMVEFRAGKRVWMECRVSLLNITNSKFDAFFGFAEQGLVATTTLITTSDAMVDKDYIGFLRVYADGDKLDTVCNTAGAEGPTTIQADAATIAADTFTKLGIYCDGTTIYFYQDGVVLSTSITLADATLTLDDEELAWYAGILIGGDGDTASIEVDWVRIAVEAD